MGRLPGAGIAASLLLSCMLAPAQAHQSAAGNASARCAAAGKAAHAASPCPGSGAARAHGGRARNRLECLRLQAAIQESEQSERRLRAALMESVQPDLFILRQRYRKLGC